jgi:hypothetical protein
MKKPNMRKVTLAALVGFCFWIAFEHIHESYIENVPLGFVGECFNIQYPHMRDHFQMRILKNENEDNKSQVEITLIPKADGAWLEDFTYFQQRMLSPKKMECK